MASAQLSRLIVLTGSPGVGKTTLIHKTCESLKNCNIPIQGFYTEELRAHGRRTGFDVVTLDGNRGPLARVGESDVPSGRREYRVGQYVVQLQAFEQTALPVLKIKEDSQFPIYIIDEIGKMELFSTSFVQAVRSVLAHKHTTLVTTIPVPKGKPIPFVEEIRSRKDAKVFTVTKENRNVILDDILQATKASYKHYTQKS